MTVCGTFVGQPRTPGPCDIAASRSARRRWPPPGRGRGGRRSRRHGCRRRRTGRGAAGWRRRGGLPVEVSRGELAELGEEGFDAGAVRRGQDAVEEGAQGGVAVGVVQGDFPGVRWEGCRHGALPPTPLLDRRRGLDVGGRALFRAGQQRQHTRQGDRGVGQAKRHDRPDRAEGGERGTGRRSARCRARGSCTAGTTATCRCSGPRRGTRGRGSRRVRRGTWRAGRSRGPCRGRRARSCRCRRGRTSAAARRIRAAASTTRPCAPATCSPAPRRKGCTTTWTTSARAMTVRNADRSKAEVGGGPGQGERRLHIGDGDARGARENAEDDEQRKNGSARS